MVCVCKCVHVGCMSLEVKPPQINRPSSHFHQAEHLNSCNYSLCSGVWEKINKKTAPTIQTSNQAKTNRCVLFRNKTGSSQITYYRILFCFASFHLPEVLTCGIYKSQNSTFSTSFLLYWYYNLLNLLCLIFYTRLSTQSERSY